MSVYHDEVEIEDFEYDEEDEMYYYPCPCGDRFQISKVCWVLGYIAIVAIGYFWYFQEELMANEETATCPSCSLIVRVIYDPVSDRTTGWLKVKQTKFKFTQPSFPGHVHPGGAGSQPRGLSEEVGYRGRRVNRTKCYSFYFSIHWTRVYIIKEIINLK